MLYNLLLTPSGRPPQNISLQKQDIGGSPIDRIINSEAYVFSDLTYTASVTGISHEDISGMKFFVNEIRIDIDVTPEGSITFKDEPYGARIFLDCYGFAQIGIVLYADGEEVLLSSEYLAVMVPKDRRNDSVQRMVNYVYMHNEEFLNEDDMRPRILSGQQESGYKSIESRIVLMDRIALCYEENFRYFKANSRFKMKVCDSIDNFEKLQYVSNGTIQYIVQHPEQLRCVNYDSGIHYHDKYFEPKKTLISKSTYSFNIYENQVVVCFLKSMTDNICNMISMVSDTIKHIPAEQDETEGYVASSFFIYSGTKRILMEYEKKLIQLNNRYIMLYGAYQKVLNVTEKVISFSPEPTAILLSVPQYRQIYDAVVSWFQLGVFNLHREQFMLSFIKINTLYEYYVLLKIYQFLQKHGFSLIESRRCMYPFSSKTLYGNTECKNTFKFCSDNKTITLYFQPVIYCDDSRLINGIGLYRNTSISFPKDNENDSKGSYYVPDFILKIESNGTANYVIIDAKFSTVSTVKKYRVPALVFKYLFSISTVEKKDKILGLCIINGKSDEDTDSITDIYDRSMRPGDIYPQAELLTLTENNKDNNEEHMVLLKSVFDKYIFIKRG
ncbi:MAG TPA: hypothetical protein DCM73_00610 [Clostridiales bacterium]|nr:hypothetical protein [Clostridiales bacterium]